jgi:hypothetical protein
METLVIFQKAIYHLEKGPLQRRDISLLPKIWLRYPSLLLVQQHSILHLTIALRLHTGFFQAQEFYQKQITSQRTS